MDLKQLFDDDRAVSPVIGVILMVAITVILAAVIGTFVLGLGDQIQTTTPTTSFETDYSQEANGANNDTLELTHGGGDTLSASQVNVSISGSATNSGNNTDGSYEWSTFGGSGDINAGSTATIDNANHPQTAGNHSLDLSSATVRAVWSAEGGDSSSVLAKWTGPDA